MGIHRLRHHRLHRRPDDRQDRIADVAVECDVVSQTDTVRVVEVAVERDVVSTGRVRIAEISVETDEMPTQTPSWFW